MNNNTKIKTKKITASISDEDDDDFETKPPKNKNSKVSKTPVLDTFGKDLTKQAEEGKIDPIVGREKEILRVSQILSRRKKNNPILIGEPGCVIGDTKIIVRKVSNYGFHEIIEVSE